MGNKFYAVKRPNGSGHNIRSFDILEDRENWIKEDPENRRILKTKNSTQGEMRWKRSLT